MSNFFQEFKVATEETVKAPWSGSKGGKMFFCGFCGTQFKVGDKYKAVYTNDIAGYGGNPLTCWACHQGKTHEEIREAWKQKSDEFEAFLNEPRFRHFKARMDLMEEEARRL